MKHTPGPWRVVTSDWAGRYVLCNDVVRGRCPKDFVVEDEANARLIAAAPELLQTLRDIESILFNRDRSLPNVKDMLQRIRTAIETAEGAAIPGRRETEESSKKGKQ